MHEEPIDLEVFSSSFCQRLAEARRVGHDEEHAEHHLDVKTKGWRCFEAHRFPYVLVTFIEVRHPGTSMLTDILLVHNRVSG